MSRVIDRIWRTASVAMITGLLLIATVGCTTAGFQTATSERVNPIFEQAKTHGHTPWRYRHMRHQHTKPVRKGQKPTFPCEQCDETTQKVNGE